MKTHLIVAILVGRLASVLMANEPINATGNRFVSPQEAFDYFRDACMKRKWESAWDCMTISMQKNELYECYYTSQILSVNEKIQDLLKANKVDLAWIESEYRKEYQKKYNIVLDTQTATPSDDELLVDLLWSHIKNKRVFYKDVCGFLNERGSLAKIGRADHVEVKGHKAIVQSSTILLVQKTPPGQATITIEQSIPVSFHLQKMEDGWLIDKKN